jgi:hypothetical protein
MASANVRVNAPLQREQTERPDQAICWFTLGTAMLPI